MVNVAQFYEEQGKYAAAEPLYRQALAIYDKSTGLDMARLASTLEGLAGLLRKAGRTAEAEPIESRAKAIRAKR
jgi:tetratricopeptide (TPR) repeat protein